MSTDDLEQLESKSLKRTSVSDPENSTQGVTTVSNGVGNRMTFAETQCENGLDAARTMADDKLEALLLRTPDKGVYIKRDSLRF